MLRYRPIDQQNGYRHGSNQVKFLILFTLLVFPLTTLAGFYGYSPVDTYDPDSGF